MSHISSSNPTFDDAPPTVEVDAPVEQAKRSNIGRIVMTVGMIAIVGVAAFAGGAAYAGSTEAATTTSSSSTGSVTTSAEAFEISDSRAFARSVIESAVMDERTSVTGNLTYSMIEEAILSVRAGGNLPDGWSQRVFDAFATLYDQAVSDMGGPRALSEELPSHSLRKESYGRELLGLSFTSTEGKVAQNAWEFIETSNYVNARTVSSGNDRVTVEMIGNVCYMIAEETNELADWFSNLDLGSENIKALSTTSNANIGSGYDGFVKPYNSMRAGIRRLLNTHCTNGREIILAGYSRGGPIMEYTALGIMKDNLFPDSLVIVVTYGGPRGMADSSSNYLNGVADDRTRLRIVRTIYKTDPVPSLPYAWLGFKHTFEPYCYSCGFSATRDAPGWSWPTGTSNHYGYEGWMAK